MGLNVFYLQMPNIHDFKIAIRIAVDEYFIIEPEYAGDFDNAVQESNLFTLFPKSQLPETLTRQHEWGLIKDRIKNIYVHK